MFGRKFELFHLFGFPIRVDSSWFFVVILISWSLATGLFPERLPERGETVYWTMGAIGAVGLFASVVLHELGHALVARRFEVPIRGITLFIFGGVAEMEEEPRNPGAEFWVAIAGPVVSLGLGVLGFLVLAAPGPGATEGPIRTVLRYLAEINVLLLVFNLVPAFPLDGGRVLRAALWHWKDDLRWATRRTSAIGSGFGLLLLGLGIFSLLSGQFVAGLWWLVLGLFLRNAAQMSYRQLLIRRVLEGEPVERFMQPDPVTVSRAIPVEELVEEYVYRHHHKMYPVVDGERLVGCVTTRSVRELPREDWATTSVGAITEAVDECNSLRPRDDAMQALARMGRSGTSRFLVVAEDGRLAGILALKDLLRFFGAKLELDDVED